MRNIRLTISWLMSMTVLLSLASCGGDDGGSSSPTNNEDARPDAFSFTAQTSVAPGSTVESNTITVAGINVASPIAIRGGEYSINGDSYTSAIGTVTSGQSVSVRLVSPSQTSSMSSATLTIGGVSADFQVTTIFVGLSKISLEAEDMTPLGNAATASNSNASGGAVMSNILEAGSGVSFEVHQKSVRLNIVYLSSSDNALNVQLQGETLNTVTLPENAQKGYELASVEILVADGSELSLLSEQDGDIQIDYVELVPTSFQYVDKFADASAGDGISVDANGNVYVSSAQQEGGQVLKISKLGERSVLSSNMGSANDSDIDSQGNLFVASYTSNRVFKITPEGVPSVFVSDLNGPAGLWIDANDLIYITEYGSGQNTGNGATVRTITPEGTVATYARDGGLSDVIGVTGDGKGEIFAGNWENGQLYRVTDGKVRLLANTGANINMIEYAEGHILIPDTNRHRIISVDPQDGSVAVFAGGNGGGSTNGALNSANFSGPTAIAVSPEGDKLYILDKYSAEVRVIDAGNSQYERTEAQRSFE